VRKASQTRFGIEFPVRNVREISFAKAWLAAMARSSAGWHSPKWE
jgi:hypothetical protein